MEDITIPSTMKAWQWTTCTTTLEEALHLNTSASLPTSHRSLAAGESLIRVHAAALNPVDYKLAELPVVGRMAIPKPATPGLDFSGQVVDIGPNCDLRIGQMVLGKLEPKQQFGTLGEYIVGSKTGTVPMPSEITFEQAATLRVCGLVTFRCLAPNVKPGDRILINGGSGGTGTFAIQIAKALGCHVTTTCSGENIKLCKELGADEVIDYRKENVPAVLSNSGQQFDLILDNIGQPMDLYWRSPSYTKPEAKYIQIGSQVSLPFVYDLAFRYLVPTSLGGGQRPFSFGLASTNYADFVELAQLVKEGKVKPVVNEVIAFEDVKTGYGKLRKGKARGKIVVKVGGADS
ncbi:NADPH:quinone reductase-like protein [Plenodomus tracheiphilus IPT5]|uniref:NADPH:quinone reductase-like protein n=1 Tax=Plenodomus tracheiphilus IPT5 TaxID=1408161 RepID=A0A6A7AYC0_9PLEO|nr:NADPH:quinone reductase-like protein [Plenodomus tracheiphilus IPT5]